MFFVPHNDCNFKLLIPYNETHKWVISCLSLGQILLFWCSCVAIRSVEVEPTSTSVRFVWNVFGHSQIKPVCPAQLFLPTCHKMHWGMQMEELLPNYSLFPSISSPLGQGFAFIFFFFAILVISISLFLYHRLPVLKPTCLISNFPGKCKMWGCVFEAYVASHKAENTVINFNSIKYCTLLVREESCCCCILCVVQPSQRPWSAGSIGD